MCTYKLHACVACSLRHRYSQIWHAIHLPAISLVAQCNPGTAVCQLRQVHDFSFHVPPTSSFHPANLLRPSQHFPNAPNYKTRTRASYTAHICNKRAEPSGIKKQKLTSLHHRNIGASWQKPQPPQVHILAKQFSIAPLIQSKWSSQHA